MASIEKEPTLMLSLKKMFANGHPPPLAPDWLLDVGCWMFHHPPSARKKCRISHPRGDILMIDETGPPIAPRLHRSQIPGRLRGVASQASGSGLFRRPASGPLPATRRGSLAIRFHRP